MTTPAWLCQVRDLRAAIAADGLTVEGALAQAATDPNLSLIHENLMGTLLAYSDAAFEAFADYDDPVLTGAGKSTMGIRFMRAVIADSGQAVLWSDAEQRIPSLRLDAPAAKGWAVGIDTDGQPVTVAVPRLSPEQLRTFAADGVSTMPMPVDEVEDHLRLGLPPQGVSEEDND